MNMEKSGARAAHLEELAYKMTEIDTRPNDGHLLGMQDKAAEAIDHLLRAMFPYHFGKARARFVETEKRTYELMRAYDALDQTLELVFKSTEEAKEKITENLVEETEELKPATADIWAEIDAQAEAERLAEEEKEKSKTEEEILAEEQAKAAAEAEKAEEKKKRAEERKNRAKKYNWSTEQTETTAADDDWFEQWKQGKITEE